MKRLLLLITPLALTVLITGCAATPSGVPAGQVRGNLSSIRLGMTKQQVVALIGRPIRTSQKLDASGTTDVWLYTDSQFWTAGQAFAAGLATGGSGPVHEGQMALNFKNDVLSSIEKQD